MRNAHSLTAVIVALLLSVSSAVEASVSTTYVEDFTTLNRCDTLQTTAL